MAVCTINLLLKCSVERDKTNHAARLDILVHSGFCLKISITPLRQSLNMPICIKPGKGKPVLGQVHQLLKVSPT